MGPDASYRSDMATPYPAHWQADVLLADGTGAHIRPIRPDDGTLLLAFYDRVSDESKYLRFFAPYPKLSRRDVERFTQVDQRDRVALIATSGADMIAIARYDRVASSREAEVAFLVEDAHHGRGVASVLLEHLAAIARERGLARFVAEVLPRNFRMIRLLSDAGYKLHERHAGDIVTFDGTPEDVVSLELALDPTVDSVAVTEAREQRAEARSVERLLRPAGVAVVGASRELGKVGHELVRNLVAGDVAVPVYPVNREAAVVAGLPAFSSLREVPGQVDLAIIAVPAEEVAAIVEDAAAKGVHSLVVCSRGFADGGELGLKRQAELLSTARRYGMRVVGPASLGVVNADPAVALNASLASVIPKPGRVAMFTQSGALGAGILAQMRARGIGLSSFVSAGNRVDVSVNDLLQYWDDDPGTDVVLLYPDSIGNPRKFTRLARRTGRRKPVVAVRVGRTQPDVPVAVAASAGSVIAAREEVEAVFAEAGVLLVDTVAELFDVAALLAGQPLPRGNSITVIGNSASHCRSIADAASRAGLQLGGPGAQLIGADAPAADWGTALAAAVAEPDVGGVVLFVAPTLGIDLPAVLASIGAHAAEAATAGTAVVLALLGLGGDQRGTGWAGAGPQPLPFPLFPTAEDGLRAMVAAIQYARWRAQPVGVVPVLDGIDSHGARAIVQAVRARVRHPSSGSGSVGPDSLIRPPRALSDADLAALLAKFGIDVCPSAHVTDADEAVLEASRMRGAGVASMVLKATAWHLRSSPDQRDVWRNIVTDDDLREAFVSMSEAYGGAERAQLVLQAQAEPGVPVAVDLRQDQSFGPVLSFGVGGVATELLGDRTHGIPPMTDREVDSMIRGIRAAPLLFGYRGGESVDVDALRDLIHRVSALAEAVPGVAELHLNPTLISKKGYAVLRADATLTDLTERPDWYRRQLPVGTG
jgi:acyl-CoA synthetase (NDP forming)/RimJ/RimL family protein N-acetyltransferase